MVLPNQIRELKSDIVRYSDYEGFPELAVGTQVFEKPYENSRTSVVALAPAGLTKKGKVLAIGTWDFRSDDRKNENDQFIGNLWRWLVN